MLHICIPSLLSRLRARHNLRKLLKALHEHINLPTVLLRPDTVLLDVVADVEVLSRARDVHGRVAVRRRGAEVVDVRGDERDFVWGVGEREVREGGEVDFRVSAKR